MPNYVCVTCGVQFAESAEPPTRCPICDDERQYVGWDGQRWTTLEELRADHRADIREEEPGLVGIGCEPSFAIGQRALLVTAPSGNVLWDCISLLDDEIGAFVEGRGGLAAIAISHPHYYSSMVEWSHAFDAPVLLHADDREWVMQSLFLAAIGDAKDKGARALETFAYRYPEGESNYERFIVHKTIFPRDFLSDFGFVTVRTLGRVELARLELGGLQPVEEGTREKVLRVVKEAFAPAPVPQRP